MSKCPLRATYGLTLKAFRRRHGTGILALIRPKRGEGPMRKRVMRSCHDIILSECTESAEPKSDPVYLVRVATRPAALRQFGSLNAAQAYFDELVLQRLNHVASRSCRH